MSRLLTATRTYIKLLDAGELHQLRKDVATLEKQRLDEATKYMEYQIHRHLKVGDQVKTTIWSYEVSRIYKHKFQVRLKPKQQYDDVKYETHAIVDIVQIKRRVDGRWKIILVPSDIADEMNLPKFWRQHLKRLMNVK